MTYAPIALFTYNRADHTRKAVESLLQNAEAQYSDLFIFSDGAKTPEKQTGVDENRKYIHSLKDTLHTGVGSGIAFKSITIIEREKNWGLANSLIAGITEVINQYGRVIVVEDDLVLSPYFLQYMNTALEKYKDEDKVGAISSYVYPDMEHMPETFFLYHFHCWGWATWKRSWDLLNTDAKYLLRKLRFKKTAFDVGGGAGAYGNLYCQKKGLVDSWWVRFYASLFLAQKLILYPGVTLTNNGGTDGTGTHGSSACKLEEMNVSDRSIVVGDIDLVESKQAYEAMKSHFLKQNIRASFIVRFYSFLRRLLYIDCI